MRDSENLLVWTEEAKARLNLALFGKSDEPLAWIRTDGLLIYTKEEAARQTGHKVYPLFAHAETPRPEAPQSPGPLCNHYQMPDGAHAIEIFGSERTSIIVRNEWTHIMAGEPGQLRYIDKTIRLPIATPSDAEC